MENCFTFYSFLSECLQYSIFLCVYMLNNSVMYMLSFLACVLFSHMCICSVTQSCICSVTQSNSETLCNPMDCSPILCPVGFSKQEYWSWLPFPPSGDLPDPGTELASPASPALASRFFTTAIFAIL